MTRQAGRRLRLIANGQQAFGASVLEALIKAGHEVVAVFSRPETNDRPRDPIIAAAMAADVPVFQPRSFRDPAVHERIRSLDADLCVMAYVTLFVPGAVLELPKLGTIQYHPSLLPRHRGPSSINWPIIQGESETGLTIFWPDDQLDAGPILLQRAVAIGDDDTLGSLYFQRLFPMGVQAMLEAVDQVASGCAPRIPQDPGLVTYEGWCRHDDAEVDWSAPGRQVWNLIRGTDPQPGAWTTIAEQTLKLYDGAWSPGRVEASPGTVVAVEDRGVLVATRDGRITIGRVRIGQLGEKVPAAAAGLTLGDRLG